MWLCQVHTAFRSRFRTVWTRPIEAFGGIRAAFANRQSARYLSEYATKGGYVQWLSVNASRGPPGSQQHGWLDVAALQPRTSPPKFGKISLKNRRENALGAGGAVRLPVEGSPVDWGPPAQRCRLQQD